MSPYLRFCLKRITLLIEAEKNLNFLASNAVLSEQVVFVFPSSNQALVFVKRPLFEANIQSCRVKMAEFSWQQKSSRRGHVPRESDRKSEKNANGQDFSCLETDCRITHVASCAASFPLR